MNIWCHLAPQAASVFSTQSKIFVENKVATLGCRHLLLVYLCILVVKLHVAVSKRTTTAKSVAFIHHVQSYILIEIELCTILNVTLHNI